MQIQQINKVKGLINISNKAGYLIIGADNLKNYKKKLYLIIYSNIHGRNLEKIVNTCKNALNCEIIELDEQEFQKVVTIENCKIVGVKNLGLSQEIIKIVRGE